MNNSFMVQQRKNNISALTPIGVSAGYVNKNPEEINSMINKMNNMAGRTHNHFLQTH